MPDHSTMLATVRQHARTHGLEHHVGSSLLDRTPVVTVALPIPGERSATRRLAVWLDASVWNVRVDTLRQEHSHDRIDATSNVCLTGLAWDDALAEVDRFLAAQAGDVPDGLPAGWVWARRDSDAFPWRADGPDGVSVWLFENGGPAVEAGGRHLETANYEHVIAAVRKRCGAASLRKGSSI
jgi:hypothetical protein